MEKVFAVADCKVKYKFHELIFMVITNDVLKKIFVFNVTYSNKNSILEFTLRSKLHPFCGTSKTFCSMKKFFH